MYSIEVVSPAQWSAWLSQQTPFIQQWLAQHKKGYAVLPDPSQHRVVLLLDKKCLWDYADGLSLLPEGEYQFINLNDEAYREAAIAWALDAYRFDHFKKQEKPKRHLVLPSTIRSSVTHYIDAHCFARDLINRPANDLNPQALADEALALGKQYGAHAQVIVGEDLLKENYPLIYAVGKASSIAPRLIDLRWGNPAHTKITLVGKGVCFDTGGLDIKPSSGMALMRKDMGGAACVLALARWIMAENLAVSLRVLIPAVENAISGSAMRPGDIYPSRKGLTVEITDTDAEGRLILADALTAASEDQPELIIDMATLTGAARVALGPDVPVFMTHHPLISESLLALAEREQEKLWPLPLMDSYEEMITGNVSDLKNSSASPYAGAITAGLFLAHFVGKAIPWVHVDLIAWNLCSRPGRPQGGEAMGLRSLFLLIDTYVRRKE